MRLLIFLLNRAFPTQDACDIYQPLYYFARDIEPLVANFDGDYDVDMNDFAVFAAAWLTQEGGLGWNADGDISINEDKIIDMEDLLVFAQNWLLHSKY